MFEEASYDAADGDRFADVRDPGFELALTAHDQIDRHARLRGAIERLHQRNIADRVEFRGDPRRTSGPRVLGLAFDQVDESRPQRRRSDEQLFIANVLCETGQAVEEMRRIGSEFGAARKERQVRVDARGLLVVVSRSEMNVAPDAVRFVAHHEDDFRVHLESRKPVDDVRPDVFQVACPVNVVLFIKARLKLDQRRDLLSVFGRFDERLNDGRGAAGPIQCLLDGKHVRIRCCLTHELNDRIERLVRMVQEQIAFANRREHIAFGDQTLGNRGREGFVVQLGPFDAGDGPQVRGTQHRIELVEIDRCERERLE